MAITCQPVEAMQTYAASATYREPIPSAKIDTGVIPLDSLPADWWNWLWYNITLNEGRTVSFLNAVFSEITSVYTAAGITPSSINTDDLKKAIEKMCQVVATGQVAGSVLSSALSGKLAVSADGTATINGLGTPSSLQTTADNVVAAINEVLTEVGGKAPTNHASTECIYGIGSSAVSGSVITRTYGHVSLSCCVNPLLLCTTFSNYYLTGMAYSSADARDHVNCMAQATTTVDIMAQRCRTQTGHVTVIPGCGLDINSGIISLNAPGYNCVGNVTTVRFNGAIYTPTSGVIDLGDVSGFPGYGTSICGWASTRQVGTSSLVARADHSHGCPWATCTAIAIGQSACTSGTALTVAIGSQARVCATHGIAIGNLSLGNCMGVALGSHAEACVCGTAIGSYAQSGNLGNALGQNARADNEGIAMGYYACACYLGIAIGSSAAACLYSIALGQDACAKGYDSLALGQDACAECYYSIVLGYCGCAQAEAGTAIGCRAQAGCCGSVRWSMIKTTPFNGVAFITICSNAMMCDTQMGLRAFWHNLNTAVGYPSTSRCPQTCAPIALLVEGTCWFSTCCAWNVQGGALVRVQDMICVQAAAASCSICDNINCCVHIASWDWSQPTTRCPYGATLRVIF